MYHKLQKEKESLHIIEKGIKSIICLPCTDIMYTHKNINSLNHHSQLSSGLFEIPEKIKKSKHILQKERKKR